MSAAADVSDSQWESVVLKSQVPVLVDFWAQWCGPCKAMTPTVDKLAAELGAKLKVVKLNIDDNPEVPSRYGVMAIPTFLLVKGGEVVWRHTGAIPHDKLRAPIDQHVK
jgi:thioredoxin 1